ncbi:unnamed protein product [Candidula unifasciata]|uniref:RING-type domain-containing protein n=1 Tax=Candidula unifasciata TaxID=100452 RepID=A0A8S3ZWV4_9EUPU|nr:unnamed protein product [Candidula unifasciata]
MVFIVMSSDGEDCSAFLRAELEQVKKEVPRIENVKLIAAVPLLVRAEIKKTEHKQVAVTCMFQPAYPAEPLVTELRSKTLADRFLDGLAKVCDTEARKLKGKPQVLHVINFVKTFIEENTLCVCSEEISTIKRLLTGDKDEIKLKQKASELVVKVHQEQYFLHIKISVPDNYPLVQITPELTEHNFPAFLYTHFKAQAAEIARRCVQPPLKKNPNQSPFVPKPSLLPTCEYLIECVKKYPLEKCQLCHERALPVDPLTESTQRGRQIEKVYCGHLFHFMCLNKFMKTPPFAEGKQCPTCGKQIFHDKWKVSSEVMETRWAHKQARQRELEEVADFME